MTDTFKPTTTEAPLQAARRRGRVLVLLDAAQRAAVAPLSTERLHAFAYLADILSPVWGLMAFDSVVLKDIGGPHYPDLQREMDRLVVAGLLEVSGLRYSDRPHEGALFTASTACALLRSTWTAFWPRSAHAIPIAPSIDAMCACTGSSSIWPARWLDYRTMRSTERRRPM
jgi:hypothetical protein